MQELGTIRWRWIRFMYIYTILGAGCAGLALLTFPEAMRGLLQWPGDEPIALSIVASVYLAFAAGSALGLREPLKFLPVLFLQLVYKLVWLVGAVVPLLVAGRFPNYAMLIFASCVTYIVGDLIAIPFPYLFARSRGSIFDEPVHKGINTATTNL